MVVLYSIIKCVALTIDFGDSVGRKVKERTRRCFLISKMVGTLPAQEERSGIDDFRESLRQMASIFELP